MANFHRIPDETKLESDFGMVLSAPTREYYNDCNCMSEECFDCLGTRRSFRQRVISNVGSSQPTNIISDYFIALNKEIVGIDSPIAIRIPCTSDPISDGSNYRDHQLLNDTVARQQYGDLEVLTLLTRHLTGSSYSDFIDLVEAKLKYFTLVGVFDWYGALPEQDRLSTLVNREIHKTREILPWAQCTYLSVNFDLPLLPENFVPTNILEVKALANSMAEQDDAENVLAMYERASGGNYQERAIDFVKDQLLNSEFEEYPVFEIAYFGSQLNFNIEAGGVSANIITHRGLPQHHVGSTETKPSVAVLVPEELKNDQRHKGFKFT